MIDLDDMPPLLIFVHIPKTAGTAVRQVISANFPTDRQAFLDGNFEQYKDFLEYAKTCDVGVDYDVIHGHLPFGIHGSTIRNKKYFSIMRNPLDRWISDYFYSFNSASGLHAYNLEQRPSIKDFANVEWFWLDNLAAKFLAGYHPNDRIELNDALLFDAAVERVENDFEFIGLAEFLDESLLITSKIAGLRPPVTVIRNSQIRATSSIISSEIEEKVRMRNAVDFRLYEYVKNKFKKRICSEKASFWRAVRCLNNVNLEIRNFDEIGKQNTTYVAHETNIPKALEFNYDEKCQEILKYFTEN